MCLLKHSYPFSLVFANLHGYEEPVSVFFFLYKYIYLVTAKNGDIVSSVGI
jgi:hypothetical protein